MNYEHSILELIKTRVSSRTFQEKEIPPDTIQALNDFLHIINQETTIQARFALTGRQNQKENDNKKLGTYGVITGAQTYIVGLIDLSEKDASTFGYFFEKIILKATDLGLQTCWLGGTFKKSDFEKSSTLQENEQIAIVSPVGYQKEKRRLLESAMRRFAGSDNRLPWEKLFFDQTEEIPLSREIAGLFATCLDMVQLAPSASNKQPWRVIKEKDSFHFFLCRTKGYWLTAFDMQKNDIGIAKCHFELSAKELGLFGTWKQEESVYTPKDWEYITTWLGK